MGAGVSATSKMVSFGHCSSGTGTNRDRAEYCRQKAEGWTGRNPLSPAVIEMEIKRLKKLKAAYEGYAEV